MSLAGDSGSNDVELGKIDHETLQLPSYLLLDHSFCPAAS